MVNSFNAHDFSTGKHSTWGKGRTIPDEKEFYNLEDGTVVPSGLGIESKTSTSLQYNEFIVYNTNQIRMRYLIKLKFNYKYRYWVDKASNLNQTVQISNPMEIKAVA